MSIWTDVSELAKDDKFVYENRVYTAHKVDAIFGKWFIETNTGTQLTVPAGSTIEKL